METPQVDTFNRFISVHKYFSEYKEWKDKGCTHLQSPYVYVVMYYTYPYKVFCSPWDAFMYLYMNKKEFFHNCEEKSKLWSKICNLISVYPVIPN